MSQHAETMSTEHEDAGFHVHTHAGPGAVRTYILVFLGLLLLTGLTLAAYLVRLGSLNLIVAVIIASMKASLVVTWFMHLKHEKLFNTLFFLGTAVFVALFLGYTMNDTNYRGKLSEYNGGQIDSASGTYAYGSAPGLVKQGQEELALENTTLGRYHFVFRRSIEGIVCEGVVSSADEKARILALVEEKTGVKPIDKLRVKEGVAPVQWSGVTDNLVTVLGKMEAGTVRLTDMKARARGYVPDLGAVAGLKKLFSDMPEGYDLTTWDINRSLNGQECQRDLAARMQGKNINFATGSAKITEDSYMLLHDLYLVAKQCPAARIEVGGHTDNVGDPAANKRLSQRRARAVREDLRQLGIRSSRLKVRGYGDTKPIADNATDEGKAANRRIAFRLAD